MSWWFCGISMSCNRCKSKVMVSKFFGLLSWLEGSSGRARWSGGESGHENTVARVSFFRKKITTSPEVGLRALESRILFDKSASDESFNLSPLWIGLQRSAASCPRETAPSSSPRWPIPRPERAASAGVLGGRTPGRWVNSSRAVYELASCLCS
jgi:hypothetical protein